MNIRHLIRQRDKLSAEIEERKQDLAALERVIIMFNSGGDDLSDKAPPPQVTPTPEVTVTSSGAETSNPTQSNGSEPSRLIGRVRHILESLNGQFTFTKHDMFKKVREIYPRTTNDVKEQDVATVIWRMANKTGELKTVSLGKGGMASIYKKAEE